MSLSSFEIFTYKDTNFKAFSSSSGVMDGGEDSILNVQLLDHLYVAGVHFVDGCHAHFLVLLLDVLFKELLVFLGWHFIVVGSFVSRNDKFVAFFYLLYFIFEIVYKWVEIVDSQIFIKQMHFLPFIIIL